MANDIGASAIDRASNTGYGLTWIVKANPADFAGIIDTVQFFLKSTSIVYVGIFYVVSGNTLKCRATAGCLGSFGAGYSQVTGLSLSVQSGDYIGIYTSGGLEIDNAGEGSGVWYDSGNNCVVDDESTYTATLSDRDASIFGLSTGGGNVGNGGPAPLMIANGEI